MVIKLYLKQKCLLMVINCLFLVSVEYLKAVYCKIIFHIYDSYRRSFQFNRKFSMTFTSFESTNKLNKQVQEWKEY